MGGAKSNESHPKLGFLYLHSCSIVRKCCGGVFLSLIGNKSEADKYSGGRHQVSQVYKQKHRYTTRIEAVVRKVELEPG